MIMAERMRLHAHSRGQASVALSSCEAEVMAASEGIKEALLSQEVLMFGGLGHYEIEIKVDSSAAHAFFHRRGVGRMKHIDSRILWLQDLIAAGGVRLKKIPQGPPPQERPRRRGSRNIDGLLHGSHAVERLWKNAHWHSTRLPSALLYPNL